MNLIILAKFNANYIQDTSKVGFGFFVLLFILTIIFRHDLFLFVITVIGGSLVANSSEFFSKNIFDLMDMLAAAFFTIFIVAPIVYLLKGPPNNT